MKGRNYVITYVSALIIGILLLIYHDRAELYNTVVIAIGFLIAVPSLVLVLMELFRNKSKIESAADTRMMKTQKVAANWATVIAGIAGLALGIWMLCSPGFFIKAIIYTLGAILVLVGVVQIVAIYSASKPLKPIMLWFIIPVLTLIAGAVVIILGPEKVSAAAGLIAGISLVVYAANGFASAGREAQEVKDFSKPAERSSEKSSETKRIEQ